ncbi:TIGR04197 family type VII secretion effector [Companilactobacillus sp. DQM5]|uniref:TIGR04197 family type VII secretion effector n=1 Tax=Companilactobacillus sp. DQM5 TaxID=3463359 RepID=UPI0040598A7B
MVIKSDKRVANQLANDIGESITDLSNIKGNSIDRNSITNVSVVKSVGNTIDNVVDFVSKYELAVKQMMNDIKSVADNFEITDEDAKKHHMNQYEENHMYFSLCCRISRKLRLGNSCSQLKYS